MASASATDFAMAIVPFANASFSKTPIGPFQKIVFAFFSAASYAAIVFGPMSNAFWVAVNPFATSTVSIVAGFSRSSPVTTSTGSVTFVIRLAISIESLSTSEPPMATRRAARKVLAMPPPTRTMSASLTSASSGSILPAILAPPRSATNGRSATFVIF